MTGEEVFFDSATKVHAADPEPVCSPDHSPDHSLDRTQLTKHPIDPCRTEMIPAPSLSRSGTLT